MASPARGQPHTRGSSARRKIGLLRACTFCSIDVSRRRVLQVQYYQPTFLDLTPSSLSCRPTPWGITKPTARAGARGLASIITPALQQPWPDVCFSLLCSSLLHDGRLAGHLHSTSTLWSHPSLPPSTQGWAVLLKATALVKEAAQGPICAGKVDLLP